jgi:hypothetical protein
MALLTNTEYNIPDLIKKIKFEKISYESCNRCYVFQLTAKYCEKMLWISIEKRECTIEKTTFREQLCDIQDRDYIFNEIISNLMIKTLQKRLTQKETIYNL